MGREQAADSLQARIRIFPLKKSERQGDQGADARHAARGAADAATAGILVRPGEGAVIGGQAVDLPGADHLRQLAPRCLRAQGGRADPAPAVRPPQPAFVEEKKVRAGFAGDQRFSGGADRIQPCRGRDMDDMDVRPGTPGDLDQAADGGHFRLSRPDPGMAARVAPINFSARALQPDGVKACCHLPSPRPLQDGVILAVDEDAGAAAVQPADALLQLRIGRIEPGLAVGGIELEGGEARGDGCFDLPPSSGIEAGRRQVPAKVAKARPHRLLLRTRDGAAQRFLTALRDEGAEGGDAVLQGDLRGAPPGVGQPLAADDIIDMGVQVDKTRQDGAACGVQDALGLRECSGRSDGGDAAALDEQIGLLEMIVEDKGAVMQACRCGVHGESPPFCALNG